MDVSREPIPPHVLDAHRLYRSGKSLAEVAERVDKAVPTLSGWFSRYGLPTRSIADGLRLAAKKRTADIRADVVGSYEAGTSELALSERHGVSRNVIARILRNAGVERRGGSEANRLRMARMTAKERKALAAPAHEATRGMERTSEEKAKRAKTWEHTKYKAGWGERMLQRMLAERGMDTVCQLACGPYNLDLGARPVAVEVHTATGHPFNRADLRERTDYLTDRGWTVVYVWAPRKSGIADAVADQVVALFEVASGDPPARGEYRVFRGDGELVTEGRGHLHHDAPV